MTSFKIASYNIHGWVDADYASNLDRVVEVVTRHDPDILCLQEVYACWDLPCLLEFLRKTLFEHTLRWEGCAILSKKKFRLEEFGQEDAEGLRAAGGGYHRLLSTCPGEGFNRPRYLCARVREDSERNTTLFYLTCIHLVPKYPKLRQEDILRISEDLAPLINTSQPQLWMGDFNTLSRSDYSDQEWNNIVRVRQDNGRQAPSNKVVEIIEKFGLQDNWVRAGRPEPRTTSRFDTRVDYIFSSDTFNNQWRLAQFGHFPYDASDHSLVVAEFTHIKT